MLAAVAETAGVSGWGWDRFERWLGATMADALIGPT